MARTIQEIQQEIINSIQSDSTLSGLTTNSASAVWRLITRVVAIAIATLENLWDLFTKETNEELDKRKPHTLRWYQQKALDFQLGFDLVEGQDYYDNTGIDPDTIGDSKVVEQAAVEESSNQLIIKVNQEVGAELEPLNQAVLDAFTAYMNDIKDAGVKLEILSFSADSLKLDIDVYYDPLILGPDGARLDGSDATPIQSRVESFLRELPFNGIFIKASLVDALQQIEGVFVPEIRSAQAARFGNPNFTSIDIYYQPYSGFFKFYNEADLNINFIEQDV